MTEKLWPDSFDKKEDLSPLKKGAVGSKIADGSFADVHEVNKPREDFPNLVVKIGQVSEYKPPLLNALKLTFSREKASRMLEAVFGPDFKINPDMDFIKGGVAEYLLMKEYFGDVEQVSAKRAELISEVKNSENIFHKELKKCLGNDNSVNDISRVVEKQKNENFLPAEQTVIGHPRDLTREKAENLVRMGKKLPVTYYIFQDDIRGEDVFPLSEISDDELANNPEIVEKLLAFAVLTKKMYSDTGLLIDTRPEEMARNPLEWFQKTANIMVDKKSQKIFFIDTRWLWKKDSRIGERGINLVKFFGVRSVDRAIRKYAELLKEKK